MSNHKGNGSEPDKNGSGVTASFNTYQKRAPATEKKIVPRDAQNGHMGPIQNGTENSVVSEQRADVDSTKFAGSKRNFPEFHPILQSSQSLSGSSSVGVAHQQQSMRSHDISFGSAPASVSMNLPSAPPSVPVSLIKPVNPNASVESNHIDYIKKLLKMTPEQLSKHAVQLEKRAKELAEQEKIEIQRKAALDMIATKPASGRGKGSPPTK